MAASALRHENCNEHQTTMFSSLHEKQKLGKFCDVVLKCSDSELTFNAHSCVLSAASTVLDKLLQNAMDSNSCSHGSGMKLLVVLPDDIGSSCMESLLNFIYSGNIDLSLNIPTEKEGSIPGIRKSKRRSSLSTKSKSIEDASTTKEISDSSSLYTFLKAAKCLKIRTLTEYLESAITLSEMKMSEVDSSSGLSRALVINPQTEKNNEKETTVSIPSDEVAVGRLKVPKMRKKKQVSEKKTSEAVTRKGLPRKKLKTSGVPHSPCDDYKQTSAVPSGENQLPTDAGVSNVTKPDTGTLHELKDRDVTPEDVGVLHDQQMTLGAASIDMAAASNATDRLACQNCQQKFKSRVVLKRHVCSHDHGEPASQADDKSTRRRKKPRRKDITSSETCMDSAAKNKEPAQLSVTSDTSVSGEEPPVIPRQNARDKAVSSDPAIEKRPPRASAMKFQTMMMTAFGTGINNAWSEGDLSKTPAKRRRKRQPFKTKKSAADFQTPAGLSPHSESTSVPNDQPETSDAQSCGQLGSAVVPLNSIEGKPGVLTEEPMSVEKMDETKSDTTESEHITEGGDGPGDVNYSELSMPSPDVVSESGGKEMQMNGTKTEGDGIDSISCESCEVCGELVRDGRIQAHMRKHGKPLRCEICLKNFRYKAALIRHMLFHSAEGLLCPVCGEGLHSQKDLSLHMAKHNRKKMRTECPICKKSYTSHYVMELHRKTHTGEEKYSCPVCKKKFPYHSSLKMHMRLHTGERPYICSICGKGFVQKINAKEHELQHIGIRRFQCDLCDRHFSHKCGLTRHISDIHHKNRPYVCESCGKSFPRKTKLIEHRRMHTGERPYICDICGVRYKANRSLKCHKNHRHNVIVPDYAVGIWKGPLPAEEKSAPSLVKKKPPKASTTFDFPISSEPIQIIETKEEEENVIDKIPTDVDVVEMEVAQSSPGGSLVISALKEDSQQRFTYQMLTASSDYPSEAYTTAAEVSTYQETVLPPASTLTRVDRTRLVYPLQGQKTFIVPLTSTANVALPVVTDGSPQFPSHGRLPGMMVTYMVPQQIPTISETIDLSAASVTVAMASGQSLIHAERSSSVPPMSSFRRHSGVSVPEVCGTIPGTTVLPGMHTFQPVKLHPTTSQMNSGLTTATPGVPVIVPMPPVISVSQTVEVQTEEAPTNLQQNAE